MASPTTDPGPDYAALVEDLELAWRSELGARYFYGLLARFCSDAELRSALERLHLEQGAQMRNLRQLMVGLGADPPGRSFRRWVGSALTLALSALLGRRFGLRVCVDAEWTVARWYGTYRAFFLQHAETERARTCEELAVAKQRHARVLETWIDHSRRRGRGT